MLMQLLLLLRARARALSPRGWLLAIAAVVIAGGVGWLYLKARRDGAADLRPRAEAALAHAAVAGLEAEGARDTLSRAEAAQARRARAQAAVARLTDETLTSEDVHAALPPDTAARLRDDDGQLCGAAPELAGCAPDPDAR